VPRRKTRPKKKLTKKTTGDGGPKPLFNRKKTLNDRYGERVSREENPYNRESRQIIRSRVPASTGKCHKTSHT